MSLPVWMVLLALVWAVTIWIGAIVAVVRWLLRRVLPDVSHVTHITVNGVDTDDPSV